ncbi:acyl-CoA dehydrogenase family protein [Mycolicibacterium hodleri]|uniref:Acyl-CoA dehydrogenase n=1 Tax=Mycolicibacterium hodleri TaxID=49897 RepID=A0A502E788_9MYCO|nr:acyl-CoA dehydrogenase family protein [Mycolicibacterium hodleri]TPG32829.1 acyl-CoA dehydrogenase [Mycolicibacterium hodleri]
MRLIPDQDSADLSSMLRSLLGAECPISLVRELRQDPAVAVPDSLWKALADAGILGLAVGEDVGGSGGGLADLGAFYVEAGRALCPTAVHGTMHAGLAIDVLGSGEQRAAWLPGLSAGILRATTALSNARDASIVTPRLRVDRSAGGWLLSGTVEFVVDADDADILVVSAIDVQNGRTLGFVVDRHAPGLTLQPLTLMGGHRACCVGFDDVRVTESSAVLGAEGDVGLSGEDLHRVANAGVALQSLDLVGVGDAVLERTVDYVTMRHQFGRPIASFQAAQHLVANMHIALSAARLAAHSAVFWIGRGRVATRETAIARMHAATAAKLITLDAHQLHAGMGYVLETDLHLWSERARVLSTLGGGSDVAAGWLDEEYA